MWWMAGDISVATPSSRLFLGLIPWYGLLIVLGAALAVFLADREASRLSFPKDTILDLALWILPIGILGARAYYVIFSWPDFRFRSPLSVLYIWEGGLAIYGGLLAGLLVVLVFSRRRKLSLPRLLDVLIPGVALAQAIGRWGNYFNQEAYGPRLDAASPFAFFPLAVLIQDPAGDSWHVATFFLESCWDFLIFLFLIVARRRLFRRQGDGFLFYVLLYASGRLVVENLRMDSLYLGPAIRVSQLLSFFAALLVWGTLLYRRFASRSARKGLLPGHVLPVAAAGVPVLLFCLGIPVFPEQLPVQMGSLCLFSLILIVSAFILYGPSRAEEVLYANHSAA